MKIYIVTDLEGVHAVSGTPYIDAWKGRPDLMAEAVRALIDEINACVEGCFRGGATEVIVRDGHCSGINVLREQIDPRADLISGITPGELLAELAGSDGMILLGYHAMAGTAGAVCEHTMSSDGWQNLWINGKKSGEIAICSYVAGELGVPLIMVSGDAHACREAAELVPAAVTVPTKKGFSCEGARITAPAKILNNITDGAETAVKNAASVTPLKLVPPVTVRLELVSREQLPENPMYRKIDARTWEAVGESVGKIFFYT